MAGSQRSVPVALVVVVALVALLAAGRWLQPQLGGQVITTAGLPGRPLAVGAGPGGVWVRGAEGWLWRVDPASGQQAGAIRLPTVPRGAELAGEVVVAGQVVWVSDPGVATVRRIDLRRRTQDGWEADGRDSC